MPSILIPAHNEEKVIAKCLLALAKGLGRNNYEIIVICNGCDDSTADVVRSISEKIICLETNIKSKTNAINMGEEYSHYFPRIYLDADVTLSLDTLDALCAKLNEGYFAVSPSVKMNLESCSYIVKSYYDIWLSLPYCKAGMIGAGVYALSESGRKRFESFPDIIADDEYVRLHFSQKERAKIDNQYSLVYAPKNLSGLIKIKTRSRLGGYELRKKFPDLVNNNDKDYYGVIKQSLPKVQAWPKFAIYLFINIFTRIRARMLLTSNELSWERDDTSRS